jgi:uncharacterized protein (DUF362 family)/NAD-dependent dihydropyrimidine dehydrogenase PreA subunit
MTVVYNIESITNNSSQRLKSLMKPLGSMENLVKSGDRVLIKPNLVAPFPHAVTDLKLLTSLIEQIRDCGGKPIIGESSGFEFDTETTFKMVGIHDLVRRLDVRLVNFEKETFVPIQLKGSYVHKVKIPRIVIETDKFINVPKLKRHSLTKATIGIKNLFGLLDYKSRRKLHAFGLERGIFALGQTIIPDLVIVDGSVVTERAVYGKQTQLNLLAVSQNITAMDVFCCQYLSLDWHDVEHIKLSVEKNPRSLQFDTINISEKDVKGNNSPHRYSEPSVRKWNDSISKKIHRSGYKALYFLDIIYNRLRSNHSIIPILHYYFGIRPILNKNRCNECGQCLPVCPVNAIRIHDRRIIARRCMPVRCLACIPACPENAISIRGRNVEPSMIKPNISN